MATIEKYETKSGTTLYRVRYRKPDGRQTDKRGFEKHRDAAAFAATVEASKLTGAYVAPVAGRVTVGELGPIWLSHRQAVMAASGYRSYEVSWRLHVQPRWGSVRVIDVRFTDVQGWVSKLAARRAPATVQRAHSILARILEGAVRDGLIANNAAGGVEVPRSTKRRNIYLTPGQLRALAHEAGDYGSLVMLLGTVGLRWGEAAALRCEDVDSRRRRANVHRNAVAVGGRIVVGPPKSKESRVVPLPRSIIDELEVTCAGKAPGDLIWSTRAGGYLSPPSTRDSWLAHAVARCRAADPTFPRVTAHTLRHTAASLAISAGANVKVVQRMLGHRSAAMTLDIYADLFDDDLTTVADRIDEIVGKMWATGVEQAS